MVGLTQRQEAIFLAIPKNQKKIQRFIDHRIFEIIQDCTVDADPQIIGITICIIKVTLLAAVSATLS